MKNEHTPGPWAIREVAAHGTMDGLTITTEVQKNGSYASEIVNTTWGVTSREDARLIAAAPALLAAAEKALALIDAMYPGVAHIPMQDYRALNETPIELGAAIAQAKGE